jgi:hypothetical protein
MPKSLIFIYFNQGRLGPSGPSGAIGAVGAIRPPIGAIQGRWVHSGTVGSIAGLGVAH